MSSGESDSDGEGTKLVKGYTKFTTNGFGKGKVFNIAGKVHAEPKRVSINIKDARGNIFLHCDTRFDLGGENVNIMCFNTCVNDSWGKEFRIDGIPYKAGKRAHFLIEAGESSYLFKVNGNQVANINYVGEQNVQYVEISGDIDIYRAKMK